MRNKKWIIAPVLVGVLGISLFVMLAFAFIVDETEQAVVLEFGKPIHVIIGDRTDQEKADLNAYFDELRKTRKVALKVSFGAGLYFKKPFIQNVVRFDDRLLLYDSNPTDIVTQDKKHLLVDNYARWRIFNPHLFLEAVQTENKAISRLDDIIYSGLREILSKYQMLEIIRTSNKALTDKNLSHMEKIQYGRDQIIEEVDAICRVKADALGIRIVDIRIKRTELPEENQVAVFARMQAERERVSKQYRSEGDREAAIIRAETDMKVKILLADAYKKAEILKGEGDAIAADIYAKAYKSDESFYSFVKSLQTLEKAVGDNTELVIGTDKGIFENLVKK